MYFYKEKIKKAIEPFIESEFGIKISIRFLKPPKIELGDLTISSGFEIAKKLKKNPIEVSKRIESKLKKLDFIRKTEIKGPGYLNIFFDKEKFVNELLKFEFKREPEYKKIIVEHTNINPNKAAHVGHLRNAVLGDTFSRLLKFYGENVEVQNYIDDTGVQVADVVYGVLELDKKSIEELKKIEKIDYYLWELYAKVSELSEKEPSVKEEKRKSHEKIEKGLSPEKEYAEFISIEVLKRHLKTMRRLNINYDVLPKESDILKLKFWEKAFETLKKKNVIFYQNEGKNSGCWVMKVFEDGEEREKVIVKSNGTVTYLGKDIAYQMWKFGILGKDFYYKKFEDSYITTSKEEEASNLNFGNADIVYNVIDKRQSYLQNILKKALKKAGFEREAENSHHFSYEIVTLSLSSAELFGLKFDKSQKYVEVSGRKGIGVKADDFIDEVYRRAKKETEKRNPQLHENELNEIAEAVTLSSIRYFLLKFSPNSMIIFDIEKALQFEGETGPYILYTYVRAKNIVKKYYEKFKNENIENYKINFEKIDEDEKTTLWELILLNSSLYDEVYTSIKNCDPSIIAKYSFLLSQKFNYFYNNFRILNEENQDKRMLRLLTVKLTINSLAFTFNILGFKPVDKM